MAARDSSQGVPSRVRTAISDNLSYILRIGKALLLGFIKSLWQQYRGQHSQVASGEEPYGEDELIEQLGGEDIPDSVQVTSLQECMLRIWQDLSNNPEITRMAQSVSGERSLEALANISEHMFATGINWGRIVVFFYFSYTVIAQSFSNWLDTVVEWAMDFIRDQLAAWIEQQGGWIAILNYIPSPR